MAASFVLPLYPLEGRVLLPGEDLRVPSAAEDGVAALEKAPDFGGAVIASLADGESVHEVAVTAIVSRADDGEVLLRGVSRCRLLSLIAGDTSLVRAQRLPDSPTEHRRSERLARLLRARYQRLCQMLGRQFAAPLENDELTPLTWRVTAAIGLTADQQQGFLNVPDAVTRGKLLLVAVRDLERRERFLRPWAHLRPGSPWN